MLDFKFSYLWVLLVFFLGGKMHTAVAGDMGAIFHKEHKKEIKAAQKIAADTSDENCPKKRKIKKRGLTGTVPQIQGLAVLRVLIYKTFNPVCKESFYTSFLYCVCHKRGPPVA